MPKPKSAPVPGKIRIIAGVWKGRRLPVADQPGLRPTPERLRETLFNWLMPMIAGARCLDLFAGSGALGFEAASRGAAEVVLVEKHPRLAQVLREQAQKLEAAQIEVMHTDALDFLQAAPRRFDLVFLDPPFGQQWLNPCCAALSQRGWLKPGARVYLEMEQNLVTQGGLALPPGWNILRRSSAGEAAAILAAVEEVNA